MCLCKSRVGVRCAYILCTYVHMYTCTYHLSVVFLFSLLSPRPNNNATQTPGALLQRTHSSTTGRDTTRRDTTHACAQCKRSFFLSQQAPARPPAGKARTHTSIIHIYLCVYISTHTNESFSLSFRSLLSSLCRLCRSVDQTKNPYIGIDRARERD